MTEGHKDLRIDQLLLDVANPRFEAVGGQREALQSVINDQGSKLAKLAQSIAERGLNPMDRLLVAPSKGAPSKFVVREGNRRIAALKILQNPDVLGTLDVPAPLARRLQTSAQDFDSKSLTRVPCFVISSDEEADYWIRLRHTGENEGVGVVDWNGIATSRFRGGDTPAAHALAFVLKFGGFDDQERDDLRRWFPITNLARLLATPDVRARLGLTKDGKDVVTTLPAAEALRPLERIVRELSRLDPGRPSVTRIKTKALQKTWLDEISDSLPDLTKAGGAKRPLQSFKPVDFPKAKGGTSGGGPSGSGAAGGSGGPGGTAGGTVGGTAGAVGGPAGSSKPVAADPNRPTLVPRSFHLAIPNPKIAAIFRELKTLKLKDHPHSISVMLRVFLELSVDVHLTRNGKPLEVPHGGGSDGTNLLSLHVKIKQSVDIMAPTKAARKTYEGVVSISGNERNPLHTKFLHGYVHNPNFTPLIDDLRSAWDNAEPFLATIWI